MLSNIAGTTDQDHLILMLLCNTTVFTHLPWSFCAKLFHFLI